MWGSRKGTIPSLCLFFKTRKICSKTPQRTSPSLAHSGSYVHPQSKFKQAEWHCPDGFRFLKTHLLIKCFRGGSVEGSACQCRRHGFNSWVGKIPWRRNGIPLQYFSQENPMDRGAWWATARLRSMGLQKSQIQFSDYIAATTTWVRNRITFLEYCHWSNSESV